MDAQTLTDNGELIGYLLPAVLALLGLVVVQLVRRRRDVKKAREAVRLVALSVAEPRPGPIAVKGTWHAGEIRAGAHQIAVAGEPEVQRGTRGRWKAGARTYTLAEGDPVIAIGVMAKHDELHWSITASPGESGVQLYAVTPRPAPRPLFPWRAPIIFAVCGAIAFGGLYGLGTVLVDVPRDCSDTTVLRLQVAGALPLVRTDAMTALARCHK
jgi:hypothetical protein